MLIIKIGKSLISKGENILMKRYVKQYGQQIGRVSKNGHKAFSKLEDGKEVVTGLDSNGNVISKITKDILWGIDKVISGTSHCERFKDGVLTSVSDTRLATNFRDVFTRFADSSATRKRLTLNVHNRWSVETARMSSVYSKTTNQPYSVTTKCFDV